YPQLQEKEISDLCPFCRGNCNFCLQSNIKMPNTGFDDDVKLQHLHYQISLFLPLIKQIRKEQIKEIVVETRAKELGGCGDSLLELKRILKEVWISKLEARAEFFLSKFKIRQPNIESISLERSGDAYFRAANREESDDNYLYWPSSKYVFAKDDLIRFRHHWTKGEPVRHVLEQTSGLSWEPMVMWRALCEHVDPNVSSKTSEVKTIDCLPGCEYSKVFQRLQ
nr:lysine-specific demethylase JMJ25-like [Tanacetum cinerariifolium]